MPNPPATRKKALFLYFELAGYVQACLEELVKQYPLEVHLVRYPVVKVAPFEITFSAAIHVYERRSMSTEELIALTEDINPDFVFVSGWADKGYLAVARHLKKKVPVILSLDNPWLGTVRQRMATLLGPLYLPRHFSHCWVPGEPNARYARKLGFTGERLLTGMYSADTALFHSYAERSKAVKEKAFPHRFIYVGRYTELKGIRELWTAFTGLSEEQRGGWELWCLGKGELESEFPVHPAVKNIGFVQPDQLYPYLEQCGVFILPAHYEHWGVVVHEFAAAGFPMVCSTLTSAATAFLEEGKNGYYTRPKSRESVSHALLKIIGHSDAELYAMGQHSITLSDRITPSTWASTVWTLINKK
ncbi:MAG: glycosyltransferase [Bacteroidia bacterium]|nr:glycosyltransferase [Bacteroidia bacterium]